MAYLTFQPVNASVGFGDAADLNMSALMNQRQQQTQSLKATYPDPPLLNPNFPAIPGRFCPNKGSRIRAIIISR